MSVVFKVVHRVNEILTKISMTVFIEIEKKTLVIKLVNKL